MSVPVTNRDFRLPRTVVPTRYQIRLEPDLATFTFAGTETVEVTIRQAVTEVVLNAAELQIRTVSLQDSRGKTLHGTAVLDEAAERVTLRFSQSLSPGPCTLSLDFTGILNDKLHGFYRSTVRPPGSPSLSERTGKGDAGSVLAVTQFEATEARRAFPCWDEPDFKAVFEVTLVVDPDLRAISNTPVQSETPVHGTDKRAVRFAPTIKMSTYLLAFVVGRLEAIEGRQLGGTPIRVWVVAGKQHLGGFAQEVAAFCLRFFEDYYAISYPGDKLDLIAIPDFAFGAMENLGAITFRETALLVDEKTATHGELERVAEVVAHEIAHMWFGDLVTMAWWNGLWLNEAFATFMEMLAVDAWRPDWARWVTFGVSRAAALLVDGLRSSRPIEFEVVAPKDAEAMFDVLTYEKGGAVLRMLEQYLGPPVFRDGVRKYLAEHQYGNAETTDLWKALGEVSGQPIPSIMDGWIFRPGYPMVTVRLEDGGRALCFSQCRFTYLRDESPPSDLWQVPINYRVQVSGEVKNLCLLLSSAEGRVELPDRPDWVVVNEGGHGFYRVRYAAELQAKLAENPSGTLAPIERFNLINDVWASVLAGLAPVREYLDLTGRFREEDDRNVWTALLGSLVYLQRVIAPRSRPALEALVRDRLGPAVARLGWTPAPGEGELTRQLRGDLLRAMGTLGNDPAVQATAREVSLRCQDDSCAVDPNIVPAVIAILAHCGNAADYEAFLERFKTAKTPQEEQRYLYSLAAFRVPALLRRTLDFTLSGEVRSQDAPFLVRSLLMNVHSREMAWTFVKENWEVMEHRYPSLSGLRRMCEGITGLTTPELEADVRQFFASRNVSLGGKTLEQYLEQLHIAVVFAGRDGVDLEGYLGESRWAI
ncbi:MAG TPA: M1 family metallopeptidase [Candidatus Methylomirabilis sp.]|nr:M1 family metallopeptidase [Candidatus Methylomirabilis sp.]